MPVLKIMKPLCLLLLSAAAAFSQPFSLGVKAGLPLTDFVNAARSQNFNSTSTTNRYLFGVTGELRLPFGLGVEMDVLYRHFNFQSISLNSPTATTSTTATSGAWEFPILAKYRFKGTVVHPFVDGGVAWDKLGGLTQTVSSLSGVPGSNSSSSSRVANNTTRGFVLGGGVDVKALLIHITPEVRFTRWGAKHFIDPSGLLNSNQTQAEFLVGFTF